MCRRLAQANKTMYGCAKKNECKSHRWKFARNFNDVKVANASSEFAISYCYMCWRNDYNFSSYFKVSQATGIASKCLAQSELLLWRTVCDTFVPAVLTISLIISIVFRNLFKNKPRMSVQCFAVNFTWKFSRTYKYIIDQSDIFNSGRGTFAWVYRTLVEVTKMADPRKF